MTSRFSLASVSRSQVAAVALAACALPVFCAAIKQPIRKPVYDPSVPAVELFDAIDQGLVEVTVIPKNQHEANLFVTNKSSDSVSIQMPQAVAAVHVLPQIFGGGNNAGGGALGQGAGNNNNSGGGQGQTVGGSSQTGAKNAQGQNVGNNLQGQNFFSVPSEKTVQLPLKTVCLAHGKPNPRPKMKYELVRLESYTTNRTLRELLNLFAAGDVDTQAAQAAAWHLTDNLSWKELAAKKIDRLGGLPVQPYFSEKQLETARELIEQARQRAEGNSRTADSGK